MANLREGAKAYQPKTIKNIADLEAVSLDTPLQERSGTDKEGKPYKFTVALVADEEYRIPDTVLGDIKAILEAKPSLKTVKVIRKGKGMDTKYTVIPLE